MTDDKKPLASQEADLPKSESGAAARIGNAPLYAAGVYARDVQETAGHYQRVFGVEPQDFGTPTPSEPNRAAVSLNMHVVFFPNFYVKIQQPISPNGPYAAGLRNHGMSIQNIQLHVDGTVEHIQAVRAEMERRGGKWTLGVETDFRAYVDFKKELGITLEPIAMRLRRDPVVVPGLTAPPLGTAPVTHVGFAVTDVHAAARAYSEIFGIAMPEIVEIRDPEYPPGADWNTSARLRVARWRQGEIGIELIESMGDPTPWSEFVKASKGNAAQVIGFDVGDRMEEVLRDLQSKGGKWIYGSRGGDTAYLDFMDTLGFVIQITGSPESDTSKVAGDRGKAAHIGFV